MENEEVIRLVNEFSDNYKKNKLVFDEELALLDMSEGVAISLYLADKPLPIALLDSIKYIVDYKYVVDLSDKILKGEFDVKH